MTIKELFDYVDEIKPNAFSNATKTVWLNEVEGMVMTEVFLMSEAECFEYHYSYSGTTPITFPNDKTIGIADKNVVAKMRPGGKLLNLAPGGIYEDNAAAELMIQSINADGLVFADGTFPVTGAVPVSTLLTYSGEDVTLLVEPPHSKLYGEYLSARIDYAHGEYDKYQNTMQMFNEFWGEFMRWFARTYRPADMMEVPEFVLR